MVKVARIGVSIILASTVSVVGFLFVMLAPIAAFEIVYGREAVEHAPAHGAAFIFWASPFAAAAAFVAAVILSFRFYDRMSGRKPN